MKKCLLLTILSTLLSAGITFASEGITVSMQNTVPRVFSINHKFYKNNVTQYIGKSYDTVAQSLGTGKRNGDSVTYSKYPRVIFYYDKNNICSLIVAPIKDCFDVKGNFTLAIFNENLGVEPAIGKIFDFDWFEFNNLLYMIPKSKNDLKPNTIIQIQSSPKIELN